jgi:hypothetical protein
MAKQVVIGLKQIERAIKRHAPWIQDALLAALYEEALAIDALSVREVPVQHGVLKGSHFVAPSRSGTRSSVEVGYGTDYAVYVHERLDMQHKAPTKAKFLQGPFEARKAGFASRLAKRTRRNWIRKRGISSVSTSTPTRPNVTTGEDRK